MRRVDRAWLLVALAFACGRTGLNGGFVVSDEDAGSAGMTSAMLAGSASGGNGTNQGGAFAKAGASVGGVPAAGGGQLNRSGSGAQDGASGEAVVVGGVPGTGEEGGVPGTGGAGESGAATGGAGDGGVANGGGGVGAAGDAGAGGVPQVPITLSAVSVNFMDTCGLFSDASIKCWGVWDAYGTNDQPYNFGYNVPVSTEKPLRILDDPSLFVVQVATGIWHTCVLLSDHSVKCWGSNTAGQLGYGHTQAIHSPAPSAAVSITTDASDQVVQLVVGEMHACVLLASNAVRCWGLNQYGQLGLGNVDSIGDNELPSSASPVSVNKDPNVHIERLEAGPLNTCALLSNQAMTCWGKSDFGELGDGLPQHVVGDDELPSSVATIPLTDGGRTVKQLVIGYHHMCMLLSDASVHCWGRSDILGYGKAAPQSPEKASNSAAVSVAPPGERVTALSAGWFHTCALISDGSVRCWGNNLAGQLGLGNTESVGDDELPSEVPAIQLTDNPSVRAVALSSGQGDHTCALLSDGSAICWGQNQSGQLGYGNTTIIGDDEAPASVGPIVF